MGTGTQRPAVLRSFSSIKMVEYRPVPPVVPAWHSTTSSTDPCQYQELYHETCFLDMPNIPVSSGPLSPVELVILGIAGVWLGTVAVIACRLVCRSRRRRREEHRESLQTLVGTPPRPLILPTLRDKEQDWSASPLIRTGTLTPALVKAGTLRLPAACLRGNGYTPLRDTVPCRTLGGLDQSDAGRVSSSPCITTRFGCTNGLRTQLTSRPVPAREHVRTRHDHPSDLEAEGTTEGSPTISGRDSTSSYPEWIRPYLSTFREQAKQEWNVYRPQTGLVAVSSISPSSSSSRAATPFPVIVVQSCNDAPSSRPDSPDSMYSLTEDLSYEDGPSVPISPGPPQYGRCVVLRSRGERMSSREGNAAEDASLVVAPASSDIASSVRFYFPTVPTFGEGAYLQVPSTSCDSPGKVEEIDEEPRQTQISSRIPSNFCGRTSTLQRAPAFQAKNTQDQSGDGDTTLTCDMSSDTGRGLVITEAVGSGLSNDFQFNPVAVSSDRRKVRGDADLDLHSWLDHEDDSSQDSTIRFSDLLDRYGCSILSSDSIYSNASIPNSTSYRTTTEDSSDSYFREIIDLYRRRDTEDEVISLHRALDGWVNSVTRKDGVRLGLGPNLPYGSPRQDYASRHSSV